MLSDNTKGCGTLILALATAYDVATHIQASKPKIICLSCFVYMITTHCCSRRGKELRFCNLAPSLQCQHCVLLRLEICVGSFIVVVDIKVHPQNALPMLGQGIRMAMNIMLKRKMCVARVHLQ